MAFVTKQRLVSGSVSVHVKHSYCNADPRYKWWRTRSFCKSNTGAVHDINSSYTQQHSHTNGHSCRFGSTSYKKLVILKLTLKVRQLILAQRKLASKEACVNEDAKVLQLSFAMTKACFSTQDVASRWLCHQVVQKAHIHKKLWPKFDKCHSHIAVMSPDKGIYIHRLSPKVLEHL